VARASTVVRNFFRAPVFLLGQPWEWLAINGEAISRANSEDSAQTGADVPRRLSRRGVPSRLRRRRRRAQLRVQGTRPFSRMPPVRPDRIVISAARCLLRATAILQRRSDRSESQGIHNSVISRTDCDDADGFGFAVRWSIGRTHHGIQMSGMRMQCFSHPSRDRPSAVREVS
jgi:hypothetical protein